MDHLKIAIETLENILESDEGKFDRFGNEETFTEFMNNSRKTIQENQKVEKDEHTIPVHKMDN